MKDKTLADVKKGVPQGGLLNPGLRVVKPFNPAALKEKLYKKQK